MDPTRERPILHPFMRAAATEGPLLENAPSPRRSLSEALFLLSVIFLPGILGALGRLALGAGTLLLVLAAQWLLRPASLWREGRWRAGVGLTLLLGLALAGALAEPWVGPSARPRHARLGVTFAPSDAGALVLLSVEPQTPAHGKLEPGDVVRQVEGQVLPTDGAEAAFRRRVQEAGGGEATALTLLIERQGETRLVEVSLGPSRAGALERLGGSMVWLGLRAAGVILLVALLLWRAGQGPSQLGLSLSGLGRDLLWAFPVLVAVYAMLVVISIPLAVLAQLFGLQAGELEARKNVADALVGTGLSIPEFFALMLLVASFEEVAFRGFLMPRLRQATGSWAWALGLTAVVFGAGHLYEGPLAVLQTAALGALFGAAFLFRGRLASVMLAHAVFNTVSYAAMRFLSESGLLERLPKMMGE